MVLCQEGAKGSWYFGAFTLIAHIVVMGAFVEARGGGILHTLPRKCFPFYWM